MPTTKKPSTTTIASRIKKPVIDVPHVQARPETGAYDQPAVAAYAGGKSDERREPWPSGLETGAGGGAAAADAWLRGTDAIALERDRRAGNNPLATDTRRHHRRHPLAGHCRAHDAAGHRLRRARIRSHGP